MLEESEYPLDPHYVQTEDGYIITLFQLRTDNVKNEELFETEERPAVLLVHGFLCVGTEWLCLSPDKSLPFMLAQEGYDVWIACQRGTRLTGPKAHVRLSPKEKEYWDFCVDELGYYDIPAFIDYIIKATAQESIFYVGHSLGASGLILALSSRPEYNSKIKAFAALTPAVKRTNCSIFLVTKISAPLLTLLGKSKFFYKRPVLQTTVKQHVKTFLPCLPKEMKKRFAGWLMKFIGSRLVLQVVHDKQVESERAPQISELSPGGTSMKSLCHVMQMCYQDKFRKYDHGREENQKRYGQEIPPSYDLGNVTAPIAVFTSKHDYLIVAQDVLEVSKKLKNVIFYKNIQEPKFFHGDFMIGSDAHRLVYQDIIQVFNARR